MKEIDQLATALVEALALIIALPIRIGRWALRAAASGLKKLGSGASARWSRRGSKKSPKKAAKIGGVLDKVKLKYEDMETKRKGGNNVKRTPR